MNRRWIVTAAATLALFSASAAMAKPGVIKTKDGRTLEGDVTEKTDGVVVTVRGIPSTVNRDDIESIKYTGTIDEQYKERVGKLPAHPTAKDHIDLARWLFDNKSYELARKETDAALAIDPNSAEATTLYTTIQSQMRLEKARGGTGGAPGTSTPRGPGTVTPGAGTPATKEGFNAFLRKYVTADDMNMIRQAEWPADDKTVKVTFANDVKRKYVQSESENAAKFNAMSPVEQARIILDKGVPDLRKDVKILNDPAPLAEYKRSIQPLILGGCATAACHGGPGGGKFFLYSNPENDAATYTNFYLLTQTSASVGGAKSMMFDRVYPEASLIAEWGLPVEISKTAHPEVKGYTWRPIFRSKQDPQYQTLNKWLNKLVTPEGKYGFTFSLDGKMDKPATQAAPGGDAGGPAGAGTGAGGGGTTTNPPAKGAGPTPTVPVVPRVPPTDPRTKPAPAK